MQLHTLAIIVFICLVLMSATIFFVEMTKHQSKIPDRSDFTVINNKEGNAESIPPDTNEEVSQGEDNNLLAVKPMRSLPNPKQNSKFAYVTLISGINKSFRYRGFLYNTLIMRKALVNLGSTADFIALVGYSDDDIEPYEDDMNLLRKNGISVFVLSRLMPMEDKFNFAEMALLKVTPWSFVQYEKIQFFDGDVMPTKNMDCFFQLNTNAFTIGAVSPLNSGWYLAVTSSVAYKYLKESAIWRLQCDWDKLTGWSRSLDTFNLAVRGGKPIKTWDFNGADMDQGLLTHYFVLNHGQTLLIDTELGTARHFAQGLLYHPSQQTSMATALAVCSGEPPTTYFAHFTGRSKPWMMPEKKKGQQQQQQLRKPNWSVQLWMELLNSLELPINSSNVFDLNLGSPLGFFNANFPKKNKICQRLEYNVQ